MNNLWNDDDAQQHQGDLALRVYSSRLLGQNPELVLHGGGNTSVKIHQTNVVGDTEQILYVKGSGWDLVSIEPAGFSPVRMSPLLALAKLEALSDTQMVNELKTAMTQADAPTPSVETILHAILPFKYVDHTHADAVVTITNTPAGFETIGEIYAQEVVIIPYIMPGFALAGACASRFQTEANEQTMGMILMNHGVFTFADTAKSAYERMIYLVDKAETYLKKHKAWHIDLPKIQAKPTPCAELATLRQAISKRVGKPMILSTKTTPESLAFAVHPDINTLSQQGPATPDHVIRTKRLPLLGFDLDAYSAQYQHYFSTCSATSKSGDKTMLDPAPRILLHPSFGMASVGRSIQDANIAADIYRHTMEIIQRASRLAQYQALPAEDIFAVEYWELEQAKLKKKGKAPLFGGEVVLVSGAASGIGKACVQAFLARGAAVVALDRHPKITTLHDRPDYLGLEADVNDIEAIDQCLQQAINTFGGIDMIILNAGIFPNSCRIGAMTQSQWRSALGTNLDATFYLLQSAYAFLKAAPLGGRVVVIGSKNVLAPGPGAAAYSVSKAGVNQLARVAALEWGQDNIRINTLHPNAVFDTGIWTESILAQRAEQYGLSIEAYKTNNVLHTEITSRDVAELAAEMCGPLFAKTTGAQIPIDGGNDRVI